MKKIQQTGLVLVTTVLCATAIAEALSMSFAEFDKRATAGEPLLVVFPIKWDAKLGTADAAWQGLRDGIEKQAVCNVREKMLNADTGMTWSRTRLSQMKNIPGCWKQDLVSRTSAWFDGLMSRLLDLEICPVFVENEGQKLRLESICLADVEAMIV